MNLVKITAAGQSFYCKSGTTYTIDNTGTVSVTTSADIKDFIDAGFEIQLINVQQYTTALPPAAANADLCFSSAALSNGTLAIAAQPSVMRPLQAVVLPGTLAITAGLLTLTYTANDGSTQVDALPLATAASTNATLVSSKGCAKLTSQVVTGLTGGATPTIRIGTNANLALPYPQILSKPTLMLETLDATTNATLGTTVGNFGVWTPFTAPNGTHTYSVVYSVATI